MTLSLTLKLIVLCFQTSTRFIYEQLAPISSSTSIFAKNLNALAGALALIDQGDCTAYHFKTVSYRSGPIEVQLIGYNSEEDIVFMTDIW